MKDSEFLGLIILVGMIIILIIEALLMTYNF